MSRLVIGKTLPVKDVGEIYIRILLAYARYAFLGSRAVLPPLFMWMVYSNAFYTGSFLSIVEYYIYALWFLVKAMYVVLKISVAG